MNISFGQILLTAILYIEQKVLLPHAVFIIMHFTVYLMNQVWEMIFYIVSFMTGPFEIMFQLTFMIWKLGKEIYVVINTNDFIN